jgi:metal-dependent amidase/aminoacylase/carboxypeptidase family protein
MQVTLTGHESHSAYPDAARAPTEALAGLMTALPELSTRDIPEFRRVTVTHVSLGQPNFGITPGHGTLFATLRTHTNGDMASLVGEAETLVGTAAMGAGLTLDISYHDVFEHLENAPQAVDHLEAALTACGIPFGPEGGAMIPSEDFAAFSHRAPAAMLFLGAGPAHPALHRPDYDFPDDLIPIGAHLFERVVRDRLG